MFQHNPKAIRELIDAAFDENELGIFCFDHFPDIYKEFTAGQSKSTRILMLVEYARHRRQIDLLLKEIEKANPAQYSHYEPHLTRQLPTVPQNKYYLGGLITLLFLATAVIIYLATNSLFPRNSDTDATASIFTSNQTETSITPTAAIITPSQQQPAAVAEIPTTPPAAATAVSGRILFSRYPTGKPHQMDICVWQRGHIDCLQLAGQLARWSPDGQQILFHQVLEGSSRLYTATTMGTDVHELPTGADIRNARHATWSPDGRQIAFMGQQIGKEYDDIFILDQNQQIRAITGNPLADFLPDWSPHPERQQLVFVSWQEVDGKREQGLYRIDVAVAEPETTRTLLFTAKELELITFPVWSPTGEFIAFLYTAEATQIGILAAAGLAGHEPLFYNVAAGRLGLAWSPDEQLLAYVREIDLNDAKTQQIAILDLSDGSSHVLIEQTEYELYGLSWAP